MSRRPVSFAFDRTSGVSHSSYGITRDTVAATIC
jgi:hypothetical protein